MIHFLRFFFLLQCSLLFFGCQRYHNVASWDRSFENKQVEDAIPSKLAPNTYTQRQRELDNISKYSPRKGETYEVFEARLFDTLNFQEQSIQALRATLQEAALQLQGLDEQIVQLEAQNQDLQHTVNKINEWQEHVPVPTKDTRGTFEIYTVQKGDSLQTIAEERYGTYTAWLALYRFNQKQLPYGPNKIEITTKLIIPSTLPGLATGLKEKLP